MEMKHDYEFKEIESHITDGYTESDWFSFRIYANHEPHKNDKILLNGKIYIVESVVDDTDDEEFLDGFLYSKVTLKIIKE